MVDYQLTGIGLADDKPRVVSPKENAKFEKLELKVANADADCLETAGVMKAIKVASEYEEKFVKANKGIVEKARKYNQAIVDDYRKHHSKK